MQHCQRLLESSSDDLLKSCYSKLAQLARNSDEPFALFHFQDYAKILLDLTYFEENELVEEDFKSASAERRLVSIIDKLNGLECLCQECFESDILHTLGTEMAECLLWRKGALFYMFCQTKQADKEWMKQNKQTFRKFLYSGIMYLSSMLSLQRPIKKEEIQLTSNSDVMALLEKGIFSDCHLLALMYAGEMCYWYVIATPSEEVCPLSTECAKKMGENFLESYSCAIDGPLNSKGWNADRAKELLGTTWK